jgi:hypothetical protein
MLQGGLLFVGRDARPELVAVENQQGSAAPADGRVAGRGLHLGIVGVVGAVQGLGASGAEDEMVAGDHGRLPYRLSALLVFAPVFAQVLTVGCAANGAAAISFDIGIAAMRDLAA